MTVKELFLSVGFDAVANALQNTHRNEKSIRYLAGYKEAFDILCSTEPEGNGEEVTFNVTPREHWFDKGSLPLVADNVEGDYWEYIVGKTVIAPDNNPFTDAELAGAILWGATFYGFTPHDKWSPFEEHYTKYGEAAARLKRKLYLPYIRDRRIIKELKGKRDLPYGIAFPEEVWERIRYCKKHQNRAKRKRYHRIHTRIKELKRFDGYQHLIDGLKIRTGIHNLELEKRIMTAKGINESWRESHVYGSSSRTDYLADILTHYSPTLSEICDGCNEIIIAAHTSEENPLSENELKELKKLFSSVIEGTEVNLTLLTGVDNEVEKEISLQILSIYHQEE